jgi:hypothetical protein
MIDRAIASGDLSGLPPILRAPARMRGAGTPAVRSLGDLLEEYAARLTQHGDAYEAADFIRSPLPGYASILESPAVAQAYGEGMFSRLRPAALTIGGSVGGLAGYLAAMEANR